MACHSSRRSSKKRRRISRAEDSWYAKSATDDADWQVIVACAGRSMTSWSTAGSWVDGRDWHRQQLESQSRTLPLSYGHHCLQLQPLHCAARRGLPGETRTHNPQLRRLVLYPGELRAV